MRLLLSKNSRKILFNLLKRDYQANGIRDLAIKMRLPTGTISEWIYNYKRYIPEKIIPKDIIDKLEIIDKKEDNWGRINGGKKTYKIIVAKYGMEEIKKRQIAGGMKSKRKDLDKPFNIDIKDPVFLEFYGILIGDGWMSRLKYKNKVNHLIGISGHITLDKDFFLYCKSNIKKLFNRKAYFKEYPTHNSIQINFSHKMFFKSFTEQLNFPIGKKVNLKINDKVYNQGFKHLKYVIRGIFDTDGSFYLDKTPVGKPYPCISIQMKSPILIKQLHESLRKNGFKSIYIKGKDGRDRITLKGSKQLSKWMKEIGSSNKKHLDKINNFIKIRAPVAQPG